MVYSWQDPLELYTQKLLDQYLCPGLAIGLAEGGEITYFHGFGYRDVEQELPMTPDTVMGIASCTKSFTALAIMQLQDAGKLSVHDPVVRYVPEFRTPDPAQTRAITLHHLLTHTAGLPPLPTLLHAMVRSMKADPFLVAGNLLDEVKPITTSAEMLDLIAATPFELLGPPGTRFSYSNDGFAILGAVVERVSGMPFAQYLQEQILDPAGMTRTTIRAAEVETWEDVATIYTARRKEGGEPGETEVIAAPLRWEIDPLEAGGGLLSTTRDMLRYCEIYRTGGTVGGVRVVSEAAIKAMTTPYVEYHDGLFYGYGLQVVPDYHGAAIIEHGGSLKGVSSQFAILPGRDVTAVVLNNLAGVPTSTIVLAALNSALGLPLETKRFEYPTTYVPTPDELARLTGDFPATEGVPGVITVYLEEGRLMIKSSGGLEPMPPTELIPVGPGRFQSKRKETITTYRFHFDGRGRVWAVSIGLRMLRRQSAQA